jgi:hypothetical protein
MFCPQCQKRVPARLLWVVSSANGSPCPHCKASLCPKPMCAVVLFALSCICGDVTLILLRRADVNFWLAFLGFFLVFAGVYAVGLKLFLRLRVRPPDTYIGQGSAQPH